MTRAWFAALRATAPPRDHAAPQQRHQADSTKHDNRRRVRPLQATIALGPAQAIVLTERWGGAVDAVAAVVLE